METRITDKPTEEEEDILIVFLTGKDFVCKTFLVLAERFS